MVLWVLYASEFCGGSGYREMLRGYVPTSVNMGKCGLVRFRARVRRIL